MSYGLGGNYDLNRDYGLGSSKRDSGRDYVGLGGNYTFDNSSGNFSEQTNHNKEILPHKSKSGSDKVISEVLSKLSYIVDTGVNWDGKRRDGRPIGSGCGTEQNDKFVPDSIFGISFNEFCNIHDASYASKEKSHLNKIAADAKLATSIVKECVKTQLPQSCAVIGVLYFEALTIFGHGAYWTE